jgi:peptidoglycan/LPS O-acetylase OafA/YrhL
MKRWLSSPLIVDWLHDRNNNFDALRLIGAVLVIFAHEFAITGHPTPLPPFYKSHYGVIGVDIFFIISGFLITQSYVRSSKPLRFLWARLLRIFPALIVVTLLLALIIGPILSNMPILKYYAHPWTLSYIVGAISLYGVTIYTVLPGLFMTNPIVQANGPLWTLAYEWTFYLIILFLGLTKILIKKSIVLVLLMPVLVVNHLNIFPENTSSNLLNLLHFLPIFLSYFGIGSLAFLYRKYVPMKLEVFTLAVVILIVCSFTGVMVDSIFVFVLGYCVLYVGLCPYVKLSMLTRTGDYSYGLYIWGWPVQQTVMFLLGINTSVWIQLILSLCVALIFAILSWHFIEKRILKLKNYYITLKPITDSTHKEV